MPDPAQCTCVHSLADPLCPVHRHTLQASTTRGYAATPDLTPLEEARVRLNASFAEAIGFRGAPAEMDPVQRARAELFDENRAVLEAAAKAEAVELLETLARATNHLLHDHDCDTQGYELFGHAVERAYALVAKTRRALLPKASEGSG